MSIRDGALVIHFDPAKEGRMVGRVGGVGKVERERRSGMNGFEISGKDGVWHPGDATIEGRTVDVSSGHVKQPVAVRYACSPESPKEQPWNLYNNAGLPASPFW